MRDHLPEKQEIIGRRSVRIGSRIVNQDVMARAILQTIPDSLVASPTSSVRQPPRYGWGFAAPHLKQKVVPRPHSVTQDGTEEEKEGGQGWTSLKTWCLKAGPYASFRQPSRYGWHFATPQPTR